MVSLPNRIDTDNLRAAHALVMQTDAKVDALELKIAKRDVALSRKFDYMEYCVRHGYRGSPELGTVLLELVASLALSSVRLMFHVPHLFILWVATLFVSEVLKFVVQDALWGTLQVFEAVRSAVVKALDDVIDTITGAVTGIYNTVAKGTTSAINKFSKFVTGGHGTHITPKTLSIPHPVIPISKEAMGVYYADLVDMRKLCRHAYEGHGMLIVHMGMRVLTLGTLCQTFRQIYPSTLVRWLGDFIYGDDFVSPHRDNCHITPITVVCFAWNIDKLVWFFFWLVVIAVVMQSFWPTLKLMGRVLYAWGATAIYLLHHPRTKNKRAVLEHHLDKHARHVSRADHLDRAHERKQAKLAS